MVYKKISRLQTYAGFVKLEHTIFSLPLIFAGALWAGNGWPSARLSLLILLAAVGARIVAMGLNRLVDAEIDARNPRTQRRELPQGTMYREEAWGIIFVAGMLYLAAAAMISPICLVMSPMPVTLFAVYPQLKRYTALAHLGLGLAWSMAPLGGWLAVSGSLEDVGQVGWLWLFSVLWVAGFDVIYATMDEAFDREAGLHSLPVLLGKRPALRVAAVLHLVAFGCLALIWFKQLHSDAALLWLAAIAALFIWQHAIASRKPEFAFFQLNGLLGFLVLGFIAAGT